MDTTRVQEYCMVGEVTVVEKVVELDTGQAGGRAAVRWSAILSQVQVFGSDVSKIKLYTAAMAGPPELFKLLNICDALLS